MAAADQKKINVTCMKMAFLASVPKLKHFMKSNSCGWIATYHRKDETLTIWTLLQHICSHFWAWLLLYSAITPKSEDKYVVKVFNWSEFHLSKMTLLQNPYFSCRQNIENGGTQISMVFKSWRPFWIYVVAKQHSQSSPVLLKLDVLVDTRPLGFEIK